MPYSYDSPFSSTPGTTCSVSAKAMSQAAGFLKAKGMTEAQFIKAQQKGEWGVLKGKMDAGEIKNNTIIAQSEVIQDYYFKLQYQGTVTDVFGNVAHQLKVKQTMVGGSGKGKVFTENMDQEFFEAQYLEDVVWKWTPVGKGVPKPTVHPTSQSVGALTDEDMAAAFVSTKDQVAKLKGLNIKGANPELDDVVYKNLGETYGYTAVEAKAKVEAYKAAGNKLSGLKKKVFAGKKKVPEPHGVPIQFSPAANKAAAKETIEHIDSGIAPVYADETIAKSFLKAKDEVASSSHNPYTLYSKGADFDKMLYHRMVDNGLSSNISWHRIQVQLASYITKQGKLSTLKKKMISSGELKPLADTLKVKKSSPSPASQKVFEEELDAKAGTFVPSDIKNPLNDIPEDLQAEFYQVAQYNFFLSMSGQSLFDGLLGAQAKMSHPWMKKLDTVSLVRILDKYKAKSIGVTNANLYEKKLLDFTHTSVGKNYVQQHQAAEALLKNQPDLPADSSLFENLDPDDAQKMQALMGGWSSSQQHALTTYTGSTHHSINSFLRRGSAGFESNVENLVREIDAGMKPVPKDFMVHRGTGFEQFGVQDSNGLAALVGKTITDKGYSSTSVGGHAAFSGQVAMDIEVPKGAKAAFIRSISQFRHENEMLLARGSKYKVLRVEKVGYQMRVRLRVVV